MTTKFIDTLPAAQRKEAQSAASQINTAFFSANEFAGKAMRKYIEVGRLLTEARQLFKGDKEFGQWRSENTTLSKSWTSRLLRVYGAYGDTPPDGLSISTLAEIAGASPDLQDSVVERTADPEQKTPSVRDVREEVKKERASVSSEAAREGISEERVIADRKKQAPTLSLEEKCQTGLELDIKERIEVWATQKKKHTVEDAFVLLGLPPFFDGRPNMETIMVIAHALLWDNDHPAVLLIREEFYGE